MVSRAGSGRPRLQPGAKGRIRANRDKCDQRLVTTIGEVDNNTGAGGPPYTINFQNGITLTNAASNTLPALNTNSSVIINGGNFTLNGGNVQRGFFVYACTVALNSLTIQNAQARGGGGWLAFRTRSSK